MFFQEKRKISPDLFLQVRKLMYLCINKNHVTEMKLKTLFIIALSAAALTACHHGKRPAKVKDSLPISLSKPAKGDKAIYGLACMGCSDTAVVLLPNGGGDPVRYNILDANRRHQVFGDIEIGDWICVIPCADKDDPNGADMVVDLDKLKATWTYQVMPHLRDVSHLSKRQQARILANMPDSIVETYMISRNYGFTLKRMGEVRSVGFVMANSSVEDDSPVEYPEVPQYTEWHAYNGKLILVKGRQELNGVVFNEKTTYDTLSFVYMRGDSLALCDSKGNIQGYRKAANAMAANAAARAAAMKVANKIKQELK